MYISNLSIVSAHTCQFGTTFRSGVLRLGNVEFEGIDADGLPDAASITAGGIGHAAAVAKNWGVEQKELVAEITTRSKVFGEFKKLAT